MWWIENDSEAVMRSVPVGLSAVAFTVDSASARSARMLRARAQNSRPVSVRYRRRVLRSTSRAPSRSSRSGRHASLHGAVLVALLALVVLWTVPMAAFYETPPCDNVEELFWGGSLEWGYYKHPPLPSWLMGPLVSLAGRQAWLTYAA